MTESKWWRRKELEEQKGQRQARRGQSFKAKSLEFVFPNSRSVVCVWGMTHICRWVEFSGLGGVLFCVFPSVMLNSLRKVWRLAVFFFNIWKEEGLKGKDANLKLQKKKLATANFKLQKKDKLLLENKNTHKGSQRREWKKMCQVKDCRTRLYFLFHSGFQVCTFRGERKPL